MIISIVVCVNFFLRTAHYCVLIAISSRNHDWLTLYYVIVLDSLITTVSRDFDDLIILDFYKNRLGLSVF